MMSGLAKVGFQQSYTYFTWRNSKEELDGVLYRAVAVRRRTYLPPELLRRTRHDILTPYLQFGGTAGVQDPCGDRRDVGADVGRLLGLRAVSRTSRGPGSEENIDNEKYEYRPRDWREGRDAGPHARPVPRPG